MVQVLVTNDHMVGGLLRQSSETYEADEGLLPWLNEGSLAYSQEQIDALWKETPGRIITPPELSSRYEIPQVAERLPRVLQLTYYDPGSAAYRYHSALNASGAAVSAFVRFGDSNPHTSFRQWDGDKQLNPIRALLLTADYVMVHMDYRTLYHGVHELPPAHARIIRFYHGSVSPSEKRVLVENDVDERHDAIQVGARLYHNRFSSRMHWLPIAMPIKDYECEAPEFGKTFRLSHSPTVRANKGTDDLVAVVKSLQADGVPIELVMIENLKHGEAIRLKQTCHATFDSFWLGIQGSGLEAAAMGQMVIAGDESVRDEYVASEVGHCPYTFAGNKQQLKDVLARAATDFEWRLEQAHVVNQYVKKYHDYLSVGSRFSTILQKEMAR